MGILRMINIKRDIVFVGTQSLGPLESQENGAESGEGRGGRMLGVAGGNKLYLSTVATLLHWLHLPLDTSLATPSRRHHWKIDKNHHGEI